MDLIEVVGHLSFGLTALSWTMQSAIRLRLTAIVATAFGIWFNYALPGGPLWQVVGWLSLFELINVVKILQLIRDGREYKSYVALPDSLRNLVPLEDSSRK